MVDLVFWSNVPGHREEASVSGEVHQDVYIVEFGCGVDGVEGTLGESPIAACAHG